MSRRIVTTVLTAFLGTLAILIGLTLLIEETGLRLPSPMAWGWAIKVAGCAYLLWALPLGVWRRAAVAAVFLVIVHYVSYFVLYSFMSRL